MQINPNGYYVVYKDNRLQWRWTFHAHNHRIIAVSSESYVGKQHCVESINLIAGSTGCRINYR